MVISQIVLRYAYYLYWNLYLKSKSAVWKHLDWRTEFELDDEFSFLLELEGMIWASIIVYPIMAWVGLIIIYFHSRFLIYRLIN